jgi:2-dehydro-3-deoxyphosphogluconate aldolase/(4S)-4-hydroxy-2-oxoglutarate aldolase
MTAKSEVLRRVREVGLVPVVRAQSADEATAAVQAILAGDVPIVEVTLTVPGAVSVIEALSDRFGERVLVGAGTVLDAPSARACILAGARFVVSPALDIPTIECCRRHGVAVFPGALTPTEVLTAWSAGADMVKIFPAGNVGGAAYIKSLKAPLPQIDLVPTGGVNLDTVGAFIEAGSAAVGVGGELVDLKALRAGQPEVLTAKARQFVEIIRRARGQA